MHVVWHFLVEHGLYNYVVAYFVGFILGGLLVPFVRRAWRGRKSELSRIADLLDTETRGGLEEVKRLVEEILRRL